MVGLKFLLKRDLDNWIRDFSVAPSVLCNVDLCLLRSVKQSFTTLFDLEVVTVSGYVSLSLVEK